MPKQTGGVSCLPRETEVPVLVAEGATTRSAGSSQLLWESGLGELLDCPGGPLGGKAVPGKRHRSEEWPKKEVGRSPGKAVREARRPLLQVWIDAGLGGKGSFPATLRAAWIRKQK